MPEYLTPEQAAEGLPFTADWIRNALRRGYLAGSKIGGRWLTTQAAIGEMIAGGANNPERIRYRRRRQIDAEIEARLEQVAITGQTPRSRAYNYRTGGPYRR